MDRGHQLIETGAQSGKSVEAVTVQPEEVETPKRQLIEHYPTGCAEIQGASNEGQSQ
ncbi:hypothetical protein ACM16X_03685 [Haloarcula japonica]|uniref:hypothetical protein n=1 Tax=Haloarcula japonica TaxID=29282 RepID=UPI0039F69444